MKQGVALLLILTLIAGAGWWVFKDKPAPRQQLDDLPAPTAGPGGEQRDSPDRQPGDRQPDAIAAARQRVADAELALETAIAARKAAETDMQAAEQELEKLERWVEEIEKRGDDPVDYADEGLARLQPAFFAYEDAFERFELAESMEAEASADLAAAKDNLNKALASYSDSN